MIEFKFSSNLTEDFIVDVNNLDHSLYPPNYVGSVESIKERFTANNEEYILAYNNDTLIGYICFYPTTKVLADKIKCLNKVIDDEISKKDILKYDDRLKNPKQFGADYFDELLERIRDIRSSENEWAICNIWCA